MKGGIKFKSGNQGRRIRKQQSVGKGDWFDWSNWRLWVRLALAICFTIVCLWFGWRLINNKLVVREVICETQTDGCEREMINWLEGYIGKPWWWLWMNLDDAMSNRFADVKSSRWDWVNWSVFKVRVEVEIPAFSVTTDRFDDLGRYFWIGKGGKVLKERTEPYGPLVYLSEVGVSVGDNLTPGQIQAGQIVEGLSYLGYKFTAKQIEENTLEVGLNNDVVVWFPLSAEKTVGELVSALQLILDQAKIVSSREVIDLRFIQPLIRDSSSMVTLMPEATESGVISE